MGTWVCAPAAGETRSECCHHEQVSRKAGESGRRNQLVIFEGRKTESGS